MKKGSHIALLGMSILLSSACFAQRGFEYQVSGNIRGLKDDSVIMFTRKYDKGGKINGGDTIITVAKNDQFVLKGKSDDIRDAYIIVGGMRARKSFTIFIEKGNIKVTGHRDSLDYVAISGTPGNEEYTAYKKIEDGIYAKIRNLQAQLKQAGEGPQATKIGAEMNAWRDSIRVGRIRFISTHPGSPSSAIYLYVLQDNIPVEQLEYLYNNFTQTVKNIGFVRMIPDKIAARKRSAVGRPAPDFAFKDISGKAANLSDYRGKYVLLEFWASWCVPCRAENPDLLKAYKKYQDKGFVVIGISLDDKKDKWEKAIQEDQLPWIHTSDLDAFDNKIAKLYGVQPIPDNFLVDPQGKIIARQLRGKEVEEKLSQVLQ